MYCSLGVKIHIFELQFTRLYEFVKGFTRKREFLFFVCGSDFGSQNLPTWQECATAVRSLCSQYELLSFSLCHYRDSTPTWQQCATVVRSLCSQYVLLSFSLHMPLSRFHYASWAYLRSSYVHTAPATETVALMIHIKVLFRCFSIASQCIHVTISLPLDVFYPVTLLLSERRLAALVFEHT